MKTKNLFTKTLLAILYVCMLTLGFVGIGATTAYAAEGDVEINATNFPDENFRNYLSQQYDENNDNIFSSEEISAVTAIYAANKGITTVKGVELFPNLTVFTCYDNSLTSLDVSKNTELKGLACQNNSLTSLDVSNNTKLIELNCSNNQLTSLDLTKNTNLTVFEGNAQTTAITITEQATYTLPESVNTAQISNLVGATLDGNILTNVRDYSVTYTYATGLTDMNLTVTLTVTNPLHEHAESGTCTCGAVKINENNFKDANFLTYVQTLEGANDGVLTATELVAVTEIDVKSKKIADLTGIEYFTALVKLDCHNNNLTSLDVSKNLLLEVLACSSNDLTALDLSNNTALKVLNCNLNYLTSLDLSANTELNELTCENNRLASLDLSSNTKLTYFDATGSYQDVSITIDQTTMTASLPAGVKAENVSKLEGATLNGNVLTVDEGAEVVYYEYFCGLMGVNNSMDVALVVENPHTHATSGKCDCGVVVINDKTFPDGNFRSYVSTNFDTDSNGILIPTELAAVTKIEYTDSTN